jgi:hypothetical protein
MIQKKEYHIIVGIPSYNEADNISFVVKQIDKGLQKYYFNKKALIINLDGGSIDNTRDIFLNTKTRADKLTEQPPSGITGKGNVLKLLFNKVKEFKPEATIVVDADLKSIIPQWVELMVEPILKGNDYVTPYYSRHKYDGTITNHIVYPIIYGLFCTNIRQPIGGEFAFSTRLAEYWLKKRWHETMKYFGIDIFMTCHAIFGNFKICSAGLGTKIHKPSTPNLGIMFNQVTKTLFINVINNYKKWKDYDKIKDIKLRGIRLCTCQELDVNLKKFEEKAIERLNEYKFLIKYYLPKRTFNEINIMLSKKKIYIDYRLWSLIMYDIINAFSRTLDRGEVIESMKALYYARVASFIKETIDMNQEKAEEAIRKQAEYFLIKREYLIKKLKHLDNRNSKIESRKS